MVSSKACREIAFKRAGQVGTLTRHRRQSAPTARLAIGLNRFNGYGGHLEAYATTRFGRQSGDCEPAGDLYLYKGTADSTASTSGRGTNTSSSGGGGHNWSTPGSESTSGGQTLAAGLAQSVAESSRLVEESGQEGCSGQMVQGQRDQQSCDSKATKTMKSQYDVPFKFIATTSRAN